MIVCPVCAKENEDFFRFCLGCGADLADAAREPVEAPPAASLAASTVQTPGIVPDAAEEPTSPVPMAIAEAVEAEAAPRVETPGAMKAVAAPVTKGASRPPAAPKPTVKPPASGPPTAPSQDGPVRKATQSDMAARAAGSSTIVRHGGESASATAPELPATGGPPTIDESQCRVCQAELQAGFAFCANCGAPITELIPVTDRHEVEPAPPQSGVARGRIVLIREDGTDGEAFDLDEAGTVIGRDGAHVNFPEDDFLSTHHAELRYQDGELHVVPLDSTNGVFIRLLEETPLEPGDSFRVGQELLTLDLLRDLLASEGDHDEAGTLKLGSPLPRDVWGRLSQQIGPDAIGDAYMLMGDDVYIGRERGDITFPEDGYVSGSHAVIARRGRQVFLKDLGSSNGSYLRLRGERRLRQGDYVLAGQQLFRIEPHRLADGGRPAPWPRRPSTV